MTFLNYVVMIICPFQYLLKKRTLRERDDLKNKLVNYKKIKK